MASTMVELFERGIRSGPHAAMAVSESHLFVGTRGGKLIAFERETLAPAWTDSPRDRRSGYYELLIANGRLYARTHGRLYCFGASG